MNAYRVASNKHVFDLIMHTSTRSRGGSIFNAHYTDSFINATSNSGGENREVESSEELCSPGTKRGLISGHVQCFLCDPTTGCTNGQPTLFRQLGEVTNYKNFKLIMDAFETHQCKHFNSYTNILLNDLYITPLLIFTTFSFHLCS